MISSVALKTKIMSILKDWFKTKYKIIPVYNLQNKICGYTILIKSILGWVQLQMYQVQEGMGVNETDNIFQTYEDAMVFLKHETTILTDEKISDTKNN